MAWGQGLLTDHKYAYQVAAHFGPSPPIEVCMRAHSGATIGATFGGSQTSTDAEVPEATPTILAQVAQVPDPSSIDLVLLNGGINDVSLQRILSPLTRNSDLHRFTFNACFRDMKILLARAVSVFTKTTCQIVLTGYYPILSAHSDLSVTSQDDRLGRLLSLQGLAIPFHLDRVPIADHIYSLTVQFWRDSEAALAQAVSEIASQSGLGNRMKFVSSPFSEEHALFTVEPWLFGFDEELGPEDEVIPQRTNACNVVYPELFNLVSREMCHHASVGHPNIAGANALARSIVNALS